MGVSLLKYGESRGLPINYDIQTTEVSYSNKRKNPKVQKDRLP